MNKFWGNIFLPNLDTNKDRERDYEVEAKINKELKETQNRVEEAF